MGVWLRLLAYVSGCVRRIALCAGAALFLLLLPDVSAAETRRTFTERAAEGGELKYVLGIPVLFLEGEPEQMGRQQAALVFDVARKYAQVPKRILGQYAGGVLWPLAVNAGRTLLKNAPDAYQRELNATFAAGQGSQAEIDALVVANALVELRCFGQCSAFLVEPQRSANHEMLFGRNFDMPTYGALDRIVLLAVCRPARRHAFASVTWPGFIGVLSGMNDAGLAVACLDSGPAKDQSSSFAAGTPLSFTFRRVLEECTSIPEAQKLLAGVKHTTWMNLAACDRQQAVVFEITPKSVVTRTAENNLLACTNHFRTPELTLMRKCWRYEILQGFWQRTQPFAWRDVADVMHKVNLGRSTTQTMVFEPAALRLSLALGRPPTSAGPFVTLDLSTFFTYKAVPSRP